MAKRKIGMVRRPARKKHAPPKPAAKQIDVLGAILKASGIGKPTSRIKIKGIPALPQFRPIRKITGTGTKPIGANMPPVERPVRPIRRVKGTGTKPIGLSPSLFPTLEVTIRPPRRRWRTTAKRPEGFTMPSLTSLPPGVECFIDITGPPIYRLMRATQHAPDHDHEGECLHPKNASSWVACIGLVVLTDGGLGLYSKFWNGGEIAYVWPNDDTTAWFYEDWKAARSKGK
jgi:hypothetical protein